MDENNDFQRSPNAGEQFLISEFEGLRDFRAEAGIAIDKRTDTLIAIASALGAGVGLLSQSSAPQATILIVVMAATGGLLIISLATFREIIAYDILATNYTYAINRIRDYFANRKEFKIKDYLLLPLDYHYPPYGKFVRSRDTIGLLNSIYAGAFSFAGYMLFVNNSPTVKESLVAAGAVLLGTGLLQVFYAVFMYGRAEFRADKYLHEGHLGGILQALETDEPLESLDNR